MTTPRPKKTINFEEDNLSSMNTLVKDKEEKSQKEEINSDKDSVYSGVLLLNNLKSK